MSMVLTVCLGALVAALPLLAIDSVFGESSGFGDSDDRDNVSR